MDRYGYPLFLLLLAFSCFLFFPVFLSLWIQLFTMGVFFFMTFYDSSCQPCLGGWGYTNFLILLQKATFFSVLYGYATFLLYSFYAYGFVVFVVRMVDILCVHCVCRKVIFFQTSLVMMNQLWGFGGGAGGF